MSYSEIIRENERKYYPEWPKYAFHMAGLENAISILSSGYVYSRNAVKKNEAMSNDNASRSVIENTDPRVWNYARFYLRPKTPTFYYFEGYHQEGLRFCNDNGVNISVPVLLLFDLEMLLQDENTVFSELGAAGGNYNPVKGEDAFRVLHFEKIYHMAPVKSTEKDIIKYRHAEILYPSRYPIAESLKRIVCRSKDEANTLKYELKRKAPDAYKYWREIIEDDDSMFSKSGLRLGPVVFDRSQKDPRLFAMKFSLEGYADYYRFIEKYASGTTELCEYPLMKVMFDVQFEGSKYHHMFTANVNLNISDIACGGDDIPKGAKMLYMKVFFDNESNLVFSGAAPLKPEYQKFRISLYADETMPEFPVKKHDDIFDYSYLED